MYIFKDKLKLICSVITVGIILFSCNKQNTTDSTDSELALSGPYLGQKLPGMIPEIFAPGIVSSKFYERDLAVSPDGSEIYFTIRYRKWHKDKFAIIVVKEIDGVWTEPEVAPFSGEYFDMEPYIQADGKKMFFTSKRVPPGVDEDEFRKRTWYLQFNIWYMNRIEDGWDEPKIVSEEINGLGGALYASMTKSGTLYFTKATPEGEFIYRSKLKNGKFSMAEKLPENVNSQEIQFKAFISPDEDYILVPVLKSGENEEYHVSFRDKNDNWSKLISIEKTLNVNSGYVPSISPDGKYIFFQTHNERFTEYKDTYKDIVRMHDGGGDIYWVDAKVITNLNPFIKQK